MFKWLTGSRQVQGTPSVQPIPVALPNTSFDAGHKVAIQTIPNPYTDGLMGISPVGFSEPNPVIFAQTPAPQVITGVADFRVSNAPSVKGCK